MSWQQWVVLAAGLVICALFAWFWPRRSWRLHRRRRHIAFYRGRWWLDLEVPGREHAAAAADRARRLTEQEIIR